MSMLMASRGMPLGISLDSKKNGGWGRAVGGEEWCSQPLLRTPSLLPPYPCHPEAPNCFLLLWLQLRPHGFSMRLRSPSQ